MNMPVVCPFLWSDDQQRLLNAVISSWTCNKTTLRPTSLLLAGTKRQYPSREPAEVHAPYMYIYIIYRRG